MDGEVQFQEEKFEHTDLVFKAIYTDEYTFEQLPIGHARLAMKEELE